MRPKQICVLFLLVVLAVPVLPNSLAIEISPRSKTANQLQAKTSQPPTSAPSIPEPPNDLLASARSLPPPPQKDKTTGTGDPRFVRLDWNMTQTFFNCNQDADFRVYTEKGSLYRELVIFPRIGTLDTVKATIYGEDYPPDQAPWYYEPATTEFVFMAFSVVGNAPARVSGFWVYLYGESRGNTRLGVYAAEPNGTAGLGTRPNMTAPVFPPVIVPIPGLGIPPGEEGWVWLDVAPYSIILDSQRTFADTFYLALGRAAAADKLKWVLVQDVVWPDSEDEGDAWVLTGSPLSLILVPWDLYLDVEVHRFPYPSEIGMAVNGTEVLDIWPYPGVGYWDNWPGSPINMTNASRYYDVTSSEPGLTFDVFWQGYFYADSQAESTFIARTERLQVDWNATLTVDFPAGAQNQTIYVEIPKSWAILGVLHDGTSHAWWWRMPFASVDYVRIEGADDGEWTVRCQGPNLVREVYVLRGGLRVTEANATDTVTVVGRFRNPSGSGVNNGYASLEVYDPLEVLNNTEGFWIPGYTELAEVDWPIWWTVHEAVTPGLYTLYVAWYNGTTAGLNVTVLTIVPMTRLTIGSETPPPGAQVVRGQLIELILYYCDQDYTPLDNAIVTARNDTSMIPWNTWDYVNYKDIDEAYAGWYYVWLTTDNCSIDVVHNVTIGFAQAPYVGQSYSKSFVVISRRLTVVFRNGYGVTFSGGLWRTSPDPCINETKLEIGLVVLDDNDKPVPRARLEPVLYWLGHTKVLPWEELFSAVGPLGHYNVTVDMTPIGGITFHQGDQPSIIVQVTKEGYESTSSKPVYIIAQPRPSYLDIPSQYKSIELYFNWTYAVPFRVVLRDGLSHQDVSHGTVIIEIPGVTNLTLELATPGLGLYEIKSLNTAVIPPGSYTGTVRAQATDYVSCTDTVSITIWDKLTIGSGFDIPTLPASVYGTMRLRVWFFFNTLSLGQLRVWGLTSATAPPEGTKVELEVRGLVGNPARYTGYMDHAGAVVFEVVIDHDDVYSFYVSVAGAEYYAELSYAPLLLDGQPYILSVRHPFTDIYIRLPWIALGVVAMVSVVLGYRQFVIVPHRRDRRKKLQAIADTFADVANLNRLLVLHKESGICIFDPFAEETRDATLVAGFLQAISTFGHDLVESPGLADEDKEHASKLRELTYEGFRILIHDGQFVRNALVLSGIPSDQLRTRLERFTAEFEKRYHRDFDHWSGRVDQFNSASDLVEEIFLVSLRLPHRVRARRPPRVSLTPLEDDLYKLGKELTKDREYIFIGQVLSTYLITAKRDKLEVLMALYQLRQKGLLMPWQMEATPAGTEAEAAGETEAGS